jgi:DNA-binding MarR family transcriptional regulator
MTNSRLTNGFGQVSNTVIRDPTLSLKEKAIYAYLCTYVDNYTNETIVSVSRISNECGVSQATVKRCLSILESKGYIKRIARGYGKTHITELLK